MKTLTLSKWAINMSIMTWEVAWNEKTQWDYYNKKCAKPNVPAPDTTVSGVSIGIGYDCGHYSPAKIRNDWGSVLPKHQVDALCKCSGLTKFKAVAMLQDPIIKTIVVPIEKALQVFYNTTIYDFAKESLRIYPDLDKLHPVEQTTIISIVYNRGGSLQGDRKKEMRDLISAIKRDNDKEMADLVRSMCRLWPNTLGLRRRREAEAKLIEMPDTPIAESDKLIIIV